ncbi:MAG: SDR family NAD(P)-dependent oxidoreductase, partial [Moorea sp. SIO2I5]|nr:SDR family NAD(P)-dependent oxidoreductase [Moorena sp. SIO2I5]
ENSNTIPKWFYRPKWREKETVIGKYPTQKGLILIFVDGLGLGNVLWNKLQHHQNCLKIEVNSEFQKINENYYGVAPGNLQHYQNLLESIALTKTPVSRIIYLTQYQEYEQITKVESLEQSNSQGIYSLLHLIQSLEKIQGSQHQVELLWGSSYSQSVLPTDKIACEKATVLGLLKTIPQEMPWLSCRHIDLPIADVEVNSSFIWQELWDVSPDSEIAYRDGKRLVSGIEAVDMTSELHKELPFKEGGIYLLSGGLGGIGREIAKYLLEHYQARLILVGRTPLDEVSDKNKAYQELQQLGRVTYQAVDICNLEKLQQIVGETSSEWGGQLDGVIHLAGIYQEKMLVSETQESIAEVLKPKVLGTLALHELVKENPEGLFIHFSSIFGLFGGISIGAYSAANRFLQTFCDYQKSHSSINSYCFAWSAWDETGMSQGYKIEELKRQQRDRGYYSMSPLQGMYSFLASLSRHHSNLLVGLDGSKPQIQRWSFNCQSLQHLTGYFTAKTGFFMNQLPKLEVGDRFGQRTDCQWIQQEEIPLTETGEIDREQLITSELFGSSDRQQTKPRNETERQLVAIFQEVLGVSTVGIHDNFFELKGDSLKMTQVVFRVREALNVELPVSRLYESPTVSKLNDFFEKRDNSLSLVKQLQTVSHNQENREEIEL